MSILSRRNEYLQNGLPLSDLSKRNAFEMDIAKAQRDAISRGENFNEEDYIKFKILKVLDEKFGLSNVNRDKIFNLKYYAEAKGLDWDKISLDLDAKAKLFEEYRNSGEFTRMRELHTEDFYSEKDVDVFLNNAVGYIQELRKAHGINFDGNKDTINQAVVLGCHNRSVQDSYASHMKLIYEILDNFGLSYSTESLQEMMTIYHLGTSDKDMGKPDYSGAQLNSVDATSLLYKKHLVAPATISNQWNGGTKEHPYMKVGEGSLAEQSNLVVSNLNIDAEYVKKINEGLFNNNFVHRKYDKQERNIQVIHNVVNGQEFIQANLHGSWSPKKMGDTPLAKILIDTLKEQFADSKIPAVIMGDSNLKRQAGLLNELNLAGFVIVNDFAAQAKFENTFGRKPTSHELWDFEKANFKTTKDKNNGGDIQDGSALDYVIVNKAFVEKFGLSVEAFKNNRMYFGINDNNSISDHKELTFAFNTQDSVFMNEYFEQWANTYADGEKEDVILLKEYLMQKRFYEKSNEEDHSDEKTSPDYGIFYANQKFEKAFDKILLKTKINPNLLSAKDRQNIELLGKMREELLKDPVAKARLEDFEQLINDEIKKLLQTKTSKQATSQQFDEESHTR